jgi:PAT family beta-lactamase induction signal transducer AmpG
LGLIVEKTSWASGFYFLGLVTLLPLPFIFFVKEAQRSSGRRFEWGAFRSFKKPDVIALGALGALYSLCIYGANQIVNPALSERFTIDYTTAGFVATVLGLGTVIGGLVGGQVTDKIGQRRSVQIAMFTSVVAIALLAAIISPWMAWLLVFVFGLAFGFYETVFFAVSMRITDGRIAATMFSILMAVANIGTGIGLSLSGILSDALGYNITFLVLAVLNLTVLPLINIIFPAKANNKLEMQGTE